MLTDLIIFIVIATIITGALLKLLVDKRKGVQCSGCPHSGISNNGCSCSVQRSDRSTVKENN